MKASTGESSLSEGGNLYNLETYMGRLYYYLAVESDMLFPEVNSLGPTATFLIICVIDN